jgi:hypothetical protein
MIDGPPTCLLARRRVADTAIAAKKQAKLLFPEFKVFIVQPSLSKKALMNRQLDLLGATDLYLMDTAAIPLGVITSE